MRGRETDRFRTTRLRMPICCFAMNPVAVIKYEVYEPSGMNRRSYQRSSVWKLVKMCSPKLECMDVGIDVLTIDGKAPLPRCWLIPC